MKLGLNWLKLTVGKNKSDSAESEFCGIQIGLSRHLLNPNGILENLF